MRKAVAFALLNGPLFAYLVWAILARRWWHVAIAAIANVALWTIGPAIIAHAVLH